MPGGTVPRAVSQRAVGRVGRVEPARLDREEERKAPLLEWLRAGLCREAGGICDTCLLARVTALVQRDAAGDQRNDEQKQATHVRRVRSRRIDPL